MEKESDDKRRCYSSEELSGDPAPGTEKDFGRLVDELEAALETWGYCMVFCALELTLQRAAERDRAQHGPDAEKYEAVQAIAFAGQRAAERLAI